MTLNKKIRTHQLEQWNFILVAGEEEMEQGTIDIRTRENQRLGKMRVDKLHEYLQSLLP
jgi:threonyl-tRNA synthetase